MNILSFAGSVDRLRSWAIQHARFFAANPNATSFAYNEHDAIQRIYVINLDREPARWRQVSRELGRLSGRSGMPLSWISRRFAAVDARYFEATPSSAVLLPHYSLADQLLVEPIPQLDIDTETRERLIAMTPQEVAVALSHIEVWKLIAASAVPYTLVLEDDVYFRRGFAKSLERVWAALMERSVDREPVDLLYLSFKEARYGAPRKPSSDLLRRPQRGLWQLSGYILSHAGAQKLVGLLPARGPIDLWVNLQFNELDVLTIPRSIIEQRVDVPSSNLYSVLPILSQVGVLTREKPLVVQGRSLPGPVFALDNSGSGLTALAMALSILGYRCCSDISELPGNEMLNLFEKRHDRAFNAYVNIGTLGADELTRLAALYRNARFIINTDREINGGPSTSAWGHTSAEPETRRVDDGGSVDVSLRSLVTQAPGRVLFYPVQHPDRWQLLSRFLGSDYPAVAFPDRQDLGQRRVIARHEIGTKRSHPERRQRFDSSPWIVPSRNWRGYEIEDLGDDTQSSPTVPRTWAGFELLDADHWLLRSDTFPSNLALFRPGNLSIGEQGIAQLTLREEQSLVRSLTSAAIASRQTFAYGRFGAELRPSNVPGLITGMFLQRNGPRQEIDIEFLGKDTSRLLVNVYYNPGNEGAALEFGYRGTPTLIDLGFDAAEEFHRYEIEWNPRFIRWRVDGRVLHDRVIWDPTPIPDLPMQFSVNLWHSRSKQLGGKLDFRGLPAHADIKAICITTDAERAFEKGRPN